MNTKLKLLFLSFSICNSALSIDKDLLFDLLDQDTFYLYKEVRAWFSKKEVPFTSEKISEDVRQEPLKRDFVENNNLLLAENASLNSEKLLTKEEQEKLKQEEMNKWLFEQQYGTPEEREKMNRRKEKERREKARSQEKKTTASGASKMATYLILIPFVILGRRVYYEVKNRGWGGD